MSEHHGISIVIPAYNEECFLPKTLSSVQNACGFLKSKTDISSEVIVIDNASTDKTFEISKKMGAAVYIHENLNISSVRNEGIKQARFPIVVAIDADCVLPEDSLVKIWEFMSNEECIGAALGVKIISKSLFNEVVARAIQAITSRITGIQGGMFVFRKDVALKIGGFSEKHLVTEDSIFALAMSDHAKTIGKKFGKLFSVKVSSLDRKEIKITSLPGLAWQILKAFLGKKQSTEDLAYWYNPKR